MGPLLFKSSSVLNWLFESTVNSTILICLILAIRGMTRKKLPAWWTYGLWLLLVLRILIPWGLESRLSIYNLIPNPMDNNSYVQLPAERESPMPMIQDDAGITASTDGDRIHESAGESVPVKNSNASHFYMTFDKALIFLWLTGAVIFGGIILVKNIKFRMSVRRGFPVNDTGVLDLLEECRTLMATRKRPAVIITDGVNSPALFGYLKPRLLLPPNLPDILEKEELRCVILHELGHLKRHDTIVSRIVAVLQVVYWFNPLVWFAFHHLRIDQEAACDA